MFKAALIYFGIVFGVGFILGPIRVLWLVPQVGTRVAELIESPILLVAIVLASRWVSRRYCHADDNWRRLAVGSMAAGFVLSADLIVGVVLRGMSPVEVFTGRDAVSDAVYYGLLGLFAVMPWMFGGCPRLGSHHPVKVSGQE